MKKIISVLFAVFIMGTCVVLTSCSNESRLVNDWICDISEKGYPDKFTLFEDGTGICGDVGCNWRVEDDKLYITPTTALYEAFSCSYYFEGDKLYLDDYGYHVRAEGEKVKKRTIVWKNNSSSDSSLDELKDLLGD